MHQLHLSLDTDERLREQVLGLSERTIGNPVKIGLFLDLNPYWKEAHVAMDTGLDPEGAFEWGFDVQAERPSEELWDLDRRFSRSQSMTKSVFRRDFPEKFSPFLLRLIARPSRTSEIPKPVRRS